MTTGTNNTGIEWRKVRTNDMTALRGISIIMESRGIKHFIHEKDVFFPPQLWALCDRATFYWALSQFGIRAE